MKANGEWDTSKADNLKKECSKISGFSKTLDKMDTTTQQDDDNDNTIKPCLNNT